MVNNYLKKRQDLLDEVKELFFKKGHELGTRDELLNYIWKHCIYPMKNYAFSNPHTVSYTMNLMIELNLCYRYGSAYWKAACLTIDSGITETDKKGTIDYGKIAEAVGNMRDDILPPCVNTSKVGFSVYNNKVLYGLAGINGVNEEEAKEIINKRPFVSFNDFLERCEVSNKAIISLIKAGAFDSIESNRKLLAMEYTKRTTSLLKSLTTTQANSIVENNLLPEDLKKYIEFNSIRTSVLSKNNLYKMINKTNGYYFLKEEVLNKLKSLGFNVEYTFNDNGNMIVEKTKLQNAFKKQTEPLTEFLKSEEALNTYNRMLLNKEWNKKFFGDMLDWEMDALRTYLGTEHGLDKYDLSYLPIKEFNSLEEGIKIDDFKYGLSLIYGTIISTNKDKHIISILTKNGVVRCKLSKQHFSHYNQIDSIKEGKTKKILSDTWLKAGVGVVLQGFKQGEVFMVKEYKSSTYPAIIKILGKNREGKTVLGFTKE